MEKITVFPMLYSHRVNAAGEASAVLCITFNNKPVAYYKLNRKTKVSEWSSEKKCSKTDKLLNALITKKKQELETKFNMMELMDEKITILAIKRVVEGKDGFRLIKAFSDDLIESWKPKEGKEGKKSGETIRIYESELTKLFAYAGEHLAFDDVNVTFLRKYEAHLLSIGNANNTIHKSWKCLKKIFNDARGEGVTKNYPFEHYDNPVYEQTDRTYLEEHEVNAIEEQLAKPQDPQIELCILFFLLGCYSGLRVSDWIKFDESKFVINGRLILRAKKNGELVSMMITKQLREVLNKINNRPLGMDRHACNRYLKVIGAAAGLQKILTNHVSRHSFAVRCAELGISIETTANLMGITTKSCKYYYQVTNRKTDNEMAKWNELGSVAEAPVVSIKAIAG